MIRILTFLTFIFIFSASFLGQDLKNLEKNKNSLINQIKEAEILLQKYDQKKGLSIQQIKVLNKQLKEREALIELINDEILVLDKEIDSLNGLITKKNAELVLLKSDYARLITESFKNRKVYNEMTFLFGAESFNDAYRRFIMLKEYNKFRKNQGISIQKFTAELDVQKKELSLKKGEKHHLLADLNHEQESLKSSKKKVQEDVNSLKQKEKKIKNEIKDQQKALKKLEDDIMRLIKASKSDVIEFSDFSSASGKLSWPVQGLIISRFGEHQHPVLKYVKVNNNGVDIKSTNDVVVKTVYTGKVTRVVSIPGYNNAVIVRHGKYLSVYANLRSVNVSVGDQLKTQDVVGKIYEGDGENSGVLHFEIWKENEKMNPEMWLKK